MDRLALLGRVAELDPLPLLRDRHRWAFAVDEVFGKKLREDYGIGPERLLPIDRLDGRGTPAAHDVALICTQGDEETPRAALRRLGLRPLRLFGDLVLRRAARTELRGIRDTPPPIELGYVILCLPRCGSTLLGKELELLGLGRPNEHLRASVVELLRAPRAVSGFDVAAWWDLVRANHTTHGVFGTKILFDFLAMTEEANAEAGAFLRGAITELRVLRIVRRNKIDQAVSDHLARKTGVWHLWNAKVKAGYDERLAAVGDDVDDAYAIWRKFTANEARLDALLRSTGLVPVEIDYDALAADPKGVVKGVAEALGRTVADDYLTTPVSLEPTRSPTHARLAVLLEARIAASA